MQKVSTLVGIVIIIAVAVILFGVLFAYNYFLNPQTPITNIQTVGNNNQNASVKVKYYILSSLDKNNKTFSVIDRDSNTLKIIVTDKTKIVDTTDNKKFNTTFSDFIDSRFYYVSPSGELIARSTLPVKYGNTGFDETIEGIYVDKNTVEAIEISWWTQ